MRLLILILLFSITAQGQIVRTHPLYIPPVQAATCTYPLDTYTGAYAAYSVSYKLNSSYSGSAYRVRESAGNTEQDIGFVGCNVDTASLKSFCGSNSCYVTTLYDQTGNGRTATQTTAANQPRVVNAGVVERMNSIPSLYFTGSSSINWGSLSGKSVLDLYYVHSTSDNTYIQFYRNSAGAEFSYVADNGSSNTTFLLGFGSPSLYANNILQSPSNRGDVYTSLNGTKVITIQGAATTATSNWGGNFRIAGYSGFEFTGHLPTIMVWTSDQSANRSGINGALNTLYTVY